MIKFLILILIGFAFGQSISQTITKPTTVTYPSVSLNCDFEKDFCNWKNHSSSNNFFWQRNKANELLDINGPLPDHTLQSLNGHYIFIQSNPSRSQNESTSIISPPLTIRYSYTTYCFKFWYHMFGEAINGLYVTLESMDTQNMTIVWSKKTTQGNQWRLGQTTLKLNAGNYRFIIRGVVGGNLLGDIAIDDVNASPGSCSTSKFCDFESEDICGFALNPVGVFNWTWHQGSTATYGTGPSFDHTTFTTNGHYMFIESSYPRNQGDNAIILSPTYRSYSAGTRCVEIWYHAYGSDVGSFNVYKLEKGSIEGKYEKLFSISGNQGNEWHVAQINFYVRSFQDYSIVFEGVVGDDGWYDYGWSGGKGDISIDDYELKEKACEPMGDCDFEENTCAWKNAEQNADFEWVRNRGSTPSSFSGPMVDHTLATSLGTYLFIETSSQSKPGSNALMVSPVFDKFSPRCFEFYYHMKGSSSTLSVIQKGFRSYLNGTVVWKDSSSDKDTWQQALVSLPNNYSSNYILILEGKISGKNSGDIAVDDLKILNGNLCPSPESQCAFQCPNGKCIAERKICNFVQDCSGGEDELGCGNNKVDFEMGTSNWNDTSGSSVLKWTRKNNGIGNEPLTDHTLGTSRGFFMLLNSNANGTSEKSAQFSSPVMRDSSSSCQIKFWYQINGKNVGGIEVYIRVAAQKSKALRVDKETYNEWVQATVNIGRYLSDFQILTEGYRNPRTTGTVAFDDIDFLNCGIIIRNVSCSYSETKCDNKNCVSKSRLCDFNDDCGDMSDEKNQTCIAYPFRCTFEASFCEWNPSSSNDYNWKRTTGFNWPSRLAPQRDHTTNTASGSYIYINTTGREPGSTSVLFGPAISTDSTSCRMRFFYYMSGKSAGKLSIKSRTHIGGSFTFQWSRTSTNVDYWERAEAYLYSSSYYSKNYQVVIEAEVASTGADQDGIIAIDDVSFSKECIASTDAMQITHTTARPPLCGYNGFRCSDGRCINKTQLCDFIKDCSNGADEFNCGKCNFEKDNCGWYDNSFGGHIFNRTTAGYAQISKDVSLGTVNGSLMNYEASEGVFSGLSRLYSPVLGRTSSFCEFEFYYIKKDVEVEPTSNEFSLFLIDTLDRKERLWRTKENSVNNDWTRVRVGLHSRDAGFRLYFESSYVNQVSEQKPILAVDETNFINCQTQFNVSCLASNVFRCNGSYSYCIPNSLLCDFNSDCVDKGDEQLHTCANYTRCDFESEQNSLCQWTNDNDADLKWKRAVGRQFLSSSLNYPTYDHTTLESDGHYYHNDYTGKANKVSRLSSPVLYPVSADCSLRLWYFMLDEDGSLPVLRVHMRKVTGGPLNLLWEKKNLNAPEWILADIPLKSDENFQIVIETVNGNSQIAIDDLSFTPSCRINTIDELPSYVFTTPQPDATCPSPNQIRCETSNECIYIKDLCNFRYDCNDKSDELACPWACNFDGTNDNLCSWKNDPKDSDQLLTIKWNVGTSSQFKNSGPQFDHSTLSADGSFLYFDPVGELTGHKARLISPVYNQAGLVCSFEFWYQLYGDSTSILNVYIMSGLTETRIATTLSSKTELWTEYRVNLPSCLQQFQVKLEGVRGSSNTSYIFVDDIRLNNCEYKRPTQQCANEEFECNSFHCVPSSDVCDLAADCCDKSDEHECTGYYRCNFEQDMCGFRASNLSSSQWVLTRPDPSNESSEPFFDHSTQTSKGHYLAVSASLMPRNGENAFLQIGIKKSQKGCKMRIWYMLVGDNSGQLGVWWRKEIYGQLVSIFSTNQGSNKWKRIDVNMPEISEFELVIEGGKTRSGILAIDDVTFTKECEIDENLVIPLGTLTTLTESENVTKESTTREVLAKEAKKGKVLILVVGICSVLVVAGIVSGIFYWKKKHKNAMPMSIDLSGILNKNLDNLEKY